MTFTHVVKLLLRLPAILTLAVFPYPVGPARRLLGYRTHGATYSLEFCSLGNFICMAHLIAMGWLVGLVALFRDVSPIAEAALKPAVWLWLVVLLLTVVVLAFKVDRYLLSLLISWMVACGLLLLVVELASGAPVVEMLSLGAASIPMRIDWGVPVLTSLSLGLLYALAATWAKLNDHWYISRAEDNNQIHHDNFERRDCSIFLIGKTLVAEYPCLLRKYLFFGFGNLQFRNSAGKITDHIAGVIFAERHVKEIGAQLPLKTRDLSVVQAITDEHIDAAVEENHESLETYEDVEPHDAEMDFEQEVVANGNGATSPLKD